MLSHAHTKARLVQLNLHSSRKAAPFQVILGLHWRASINQNEQELTDSEGEVCSPHDHNSIPAPSKAKDMHQ